MHSSITAHWVLCTCENPLRHYKLVGEDFATGGVFSLAGCMGLLKVLKRNNVVRWEEVVRLGIAFICLTLPDEVDSDLTGCTAPILYITRGRESRFLPLNPLQLALDRIGFTEHTRDDDPGCVRGIQN